MCHAAIFGLVAQQNAAKQQYTVGRYARRAILLKISG
jgi:hypothetical protein